MKTSIRVLIFCLLFIHQVIECQDQINGYKKLVYDEKLGVKYKQLSFVMENPESDVVLFKSEKSILKFTKDTLYEIKTEKGKIVTYCNGIKNPDNKNLDKYLYSVFFENQYQCWIDNMNNIWILENNQLVKFDGNAITRYEPKTEFLYDINAITEDLKGNVWFSMKNSGLMKLSEGKFFQLNESNILIGEKVYLTIIDGKNNIWFCTEKGLNISKGESFITYTNDSAKIKFRATSFIEVGDSAIWISSYKGHASFFNGKQWTEYKTDRNYATAKGYALLDMASRAIDPSEFPTYLIIDINKNVYLHDFDNKIFKLDNISGTIINESNFPWKSSVATIYYFGIITPFLPEYLYNADKLINKLTGSLKAEDIDRISLQGLHLIHVDMHNNMWFKGPANITLLKKL